MLVLVGLYLIFALEASGRVRGAAVTALCAILAGLYVVVLITPPVRRFFDLALLTAGAAPQGTTFSSVVWGRVTGVSLAG